MILYCMQLKCTFSHYFSCIFFTWERQTEAFHFKKAKFYKKPKYHWIFSKQNRKWVHTEFFEFISGKNSGFPWDGFTSLVSRHFGKVLQEHLESITWGNNLLLKEHGDWKGPCCPDKPLLFKPWRVLCTVLMSFVS